MNSFQFYWKPDWQCFPTNNSIWYFLDKAFILTIHKIHTYHTVDNSNFALKLKNNFQKNVSKLVFQMAINQSNFHKYDLKSKISRFRRSPREGPNSFPVLPEPEETSGRSPIKDRNSGERKCARGNKKKSFSSLFLK